MPEKVSKPNEKSEAEKAEDRKLVEEIENDPANPPADFDPLEAQGLALPNSIKGSDGDKQHVMDADGGGSSAPDDEAEDEDFDSEDDPDTLTA